jgi:hypothetical protein
MPEYFEYLPKFNPREYLSKTPFGIEASRNTIKLKL